MFHIKQLNKRHVVNAAAYAVIAATYARPQGRRLVLINATGLHLIAKLRKYQHLQCQLSAISTGSQRPYVVDRLQHVHRKNLTLGNVKMGFYNLNIMAVPKTSQKSRGADTLPDQSQVASTLCHLIQIFENDVHDVLHVLQRTLWRCCVAQAALPRCWNVHSRKHVGNLPGRLQGAYTPPPPIVPHAGEGYTYVCAVCQSTNTLPHTGESASRSEN
jgi:hypothetical protein